MLALIIVLILIALFIFSMLALMAGAAMIIGAIWLGLFLLQTALGLAIKKITGTKPRWLFSLKSFVIEGILAFAAAMIYFNTPVDSGKLIPDNYASVTYSTTTDNGGDQTLAHTEQLAAMMQLLEGHQLKRRINLRFLNEGTVMHENFGGIFLYFRDEDGELIQKIRIYGDLFGTARREDGDFIYYTCENVWNEDAFKVVLYLEQREKVYDRYAEPLTSLSESWDYADGVFYFTMPEWNTDDWSFSIDARVAVLDENGEKTDTDYIRYLEDRCAASDWVPNEEASFSLLDALHESLSYTVKLEGYTFETVLRLSAIDEQYVYPEHEG